MEFPRLSLSRALQAVAFAILLAFSVAHYWIDAWLYRLAGYDWSRFILMRTMLIIVPLALWGVFVLYETYELALYASERRFFIGVVYDHTGCGQLDRLEVWKYALAGALLRVEEDKDKKSAQKNPQKSTAQNSQRSTVKIECDGGTVECTFVDTETLNRMYETNREEVERRLGYLVYVFFRRVKDAEVIDYVLLSDMHMEELIESAVPHEVPVQNRLIRAQAIPVTLLKLEGGAYDVIRAKLQSEFKNLSPEVPIYVLRDAPNRARSNENLNRVLVNVAAQAVDRLRSIELSGRLDIAIKRERELEDIASKSQASAAQLTRVLMRLASLAI